MTTKSRHADLIARAVAANDKLGTAMAKLPAIAGELRLTRSTPVEGPFETPLDAPQTRNEILAARRRAHRSGSPSKIEADPEMRAFIAAQIDTHTFAQWWQKSSKPSSRNRHVSRLGIHRWLGKRAATTITIAKNHLWSDYPTKSGPLSDVVGWHCQTLSLTTFVPERGGSPRSSRGATARRVAA